MMALRLRKLLRDVTEQHDDLHWHQSEEYMNVYYLEGPMESVKIQENEGVIYFQLRGPEIIEEKHHRSGDAIRNRLDDYAERLSNRS
jgi:hypothetical protein